VRYRTKYRGNQSNCIWQAFYFSKWWPSAILDLFCACLDTSNWVLFPVNSTAAAPSTLSCQLPVVSDQPQIRATETKPNHNVTLTLILTLTLLTLLTRRCNMIGQSVAAWSYWSGLIIYKAVLNCFCLDHPRRAFGGLYHCTKFGSNRCISFNNMQVLIFCELGLKTPIHAHKMEMWEIWPTKWRTVSSRPPKGISLRGSTSCDV